MQVLIRLLWVTTLFCTTHALQAAAMPLILPINHVADQQYDLAINIPTQYRALPASEKGAIPGILALLSEGYDQDIQNFIYDGQVKRRLPQIIRLQKTADKPLNVNQFIYALKTKMKKSLLVPPQIVEETMLVTKEYTLHSLGLILGYSGQANVEVIYLQYYSGNNALSGIQVGRTLSPQASSQPVSLESAKLELKALKDFVDNVSFVRQQNTHLSP